MAFFFLVSFNKRLRILISFITNFIHIPMNFNRLLIHFHKMSYNF